MADGIGSMAEVGPGGAYAGRVVGLLPTLHAVGSVGGLAASAYIHRRQKAKEFNDAPGDTIVGADQGQKVWE